MRIQRAGKSLIVTRNPITLEKVDGARALVEPAAAAYVAMWLSNVTVAQAAEELGVSESVVKTLRDHFGITGRTD